MKQFLKTLVLLVVGLFLVVSGLNAGLNRLAHSVTQNSFTVYNEQGSVVLAYEGDLSGCKAYVTKPGPIAVPSFLHRT